MSFRSLPFCLLIFAILHGDEIELINGRVIEGEIVQKGEDTTVVKLKSGGKIKIKSDDISRVRSKVSFEVLLKSQLNSLKPNDANTRAWLAEECQVAFRS